MGSLEENHCRQFGYESVAASDPPEPQTESMRPCGAEDGLGKKPYGGLQ